MKGKNFTPFPVLKTERLTLRQLKSSDDKEIFVLRSNDSVNKYLDRKRSRTMEDAQHFIRTVNENIERNNSIYWAISLNNEDKLVGTICLFSFSEDGLQAEIGFELVPDFQGKGIMQEATATVIQFGFQQAGLNWIEASAHAENKSSIRLLERLNFKRASAADENLIVFKLKHNS